MSNFFRANFFAVEYFEGDQYWRPKVPVPAPVVSAPSGGGGIWPWYRMKEEECAEWAKENAELFRKERKWKKLPRLDPLEVIKKKKELSELEKKNKAIRKLSREIEELRAQLEVAKRGGDELEKIRRDGEVRRSEKEKLRKRIRWLLKLVSTLNKRIEKLEKEREEQIRLEKEKEKIKAVEPAPALIPPVEAPPEDLVPSAEEPYWREISDLEDRKRRYLAALPWAFGAGCMYLGTRYLISDDLRWLKVVGYVGTGVLATVAVIKLADIDLGYWLVGEGAKSPVLTS